MLVKLTQDLKNGFGPWKEMLLANGHKLQEHGATCIFAATEKDNDNKLTTSKPLLNKEIYDQFNDALRERNERGHYAEITFIGVNSATIKEHKKIDKVLNVTVHFIAEVITCIRDKDKKIISGDPEKIKKIYDTWVFSRDVTSPNPNWQLVNTLT